MSNKVKQFFKQFDYINKKINPPVIASALTFFLFITFIPFYHLSLYLINKLEIVNNSLMIERGYNVIGVVSYIISSVWASSGFINTLHLISDIIFFETKERPRLKLRILSVFYTFGLLFIIIIEIVLVQYFSYLKPKNHTIVYVLISLVEMFFPLIILFTVFSLLYKYVIPIKIKLKEVWKTGLLISTIIYILMILYQQTIQKYLLIMYFDVYGVFANIVTLLIWIYLNCYIFLIGMCYIFIKKEYIK